MPWSEVVGRSRQELWKLRDRARPPGSVFQASLGPELSGTVPPSLVGLRDPEACAAWCWAHDAERAAATVRRADRIMVGEVPLLGLGWLDVGSPPDWSRDPATGITTPMVPWNRIDFLDRASVGDSKAVWELSRHQYLLTVAQAYRLTDDERYRSHVWDQIEDWIEANPFGRGINWSSSLEVALRAVTWSWLWHLADGGASLDPAAAARFLRALEWHGVHIERYLSTWFSPNTHLTGEALGLCVLAAFWPEAARAPVWWRIGSAILDRELSRQLGDDGWHMERSTCYHRYTLDFYLHYLLLLRGRGQDVRPELVERVGAMADALSCLRCPDGRLVAVGDEDGGRFLPLGDMGPLEPGATMLLAGALLDRAGARESAAARWELVWTLGPDAAVREASEPQRGPSIRVLPEAGFATLRAGDDFAFVSAGIQREDGDCIGHVHDDAMGIELWLKGAPVVVDPGTHTYTGDPDRRAWYRSAGAHSSVLPGDQGGAPPHEPFRWLQLRRASPGPAGAGDGYGYLSLRCPLGERLVHDRLVVWREGGGWLIWDRVRGPSDASLRARFQWTSGCPVGEGGDGTVSVGNARILFVGPLVDGDRGRLVPSEVSPVYGRCIPATAWEARGTHTLPVDGVTLVRSSRALAQALRTRRLIGVGGLGRVVWLGGPAGERIGLMESLGTDIADFPGPGTVRLRWSGGGLPPLDLSIDPLP